MVQLFLFNKGRFMKLSSILDPEVIYCVVKEKDRKSIYESMLAESKERLSIEINPAEIAELIMEKEDATQIPYERGIAMPHIRDSRLKDLNVMIGILEKPLQLKENDISETEIIIMSLVSDNTSDTYLKSLSAFIKFLIKEENKNSFTKCASSEDVLKLLDDSNVELKSSITAEDVMTNKNPFIYCNEKIEKAFDLFTKHSIIQLPVIEEKTNKFLGVLDAVEIIKKSVPDYILMMDNIKFLKSFEPFEKLLKNENEISVKEYIREPHCIAKKSTPLIQLTVPLVKDDAKNIFVIDNGELAGIVTISDIITKVLRG